MTKIFIVHHTHNYGESFNAYTTLKNAQKSAENICKEYYPSVDHYEDVGEFTDGDDFIQINEVELED